MFMASFCHLNGNGSRFYDTQLKNCYFLLGVIETMFFSNGDHRSARPQVIERFTLEDLPAESGQDQG